MQEDKAWLAVGIPAHPRGVKWGSMRSGLGAGQLSLAVLNWKEHFLLDLVLNETGKLLSQS